jgi:isopentenyl-diphosphate Delta-isomerase
LEQIVLLDDQGNKIGVAEKLASHHASTPLHLAFSCYVFNEKGEFLVTQRAHTKKVWPDVWTNSVCGHPAPDEEMIDAIKRRLDYELGMQAKDFEIVLPDYRYTTPPYNGIIENEVCPVYVARAANDPRPNPEEVDAYKWMNWQDYVAACESDDSDIYSWWCKDQLKQLKNNPLIAKYSETT